MRRSARLGSVLVGVVLMCRGGAPLPEVGERLVGLGVSPRAVALARCPFGGIIDFAPAAADFDASLPWIRLTSWRPLRSVHHVVVARAEYAVLRGDVSGVLSAYETTSSAIDRALDEHMDVVASIDDGAVRTAAATDAAGTAILGQCEFRRTTSWLADLAFAHRTRVDELVADFARLGAGSTLYAVLHPPPTTAAPTPFDDIRPRHGSIADNSVLLGSLRGVTITYVLPEGWRHSSKPIATSVDGWWNDGVALDFDSGKQREIEIDARYSPNASLDVWLLNVSGTPYALLGRVDMRAGLTSTLRLTIATDRSVAAARGQRLDVVRADHDG